MTQATVVRALFLCILLIAGLVRPAQALVGGDIYKDAPDLFCPARVVSVVPIHVPVQPDENDLGNDNMFAVVLQADTENPFRGRCNFFPATNRFY